MGPDAPMGVLSFRFPFLFLCFPAAENGALLAAGSMQQQRDWRDVSNAKTRRKTHGMLLVGVWVGLGSSGVGLMQRTAH
jgi:hypothetical protein